MKTFRLIGMALVAVMLSFAMSACSDDDDEYMKELEKKYSQLIVGKWFNFTPEVSAFLDYKADGSYSVAAYHQENGWVISPAGQYRLKGNLLTLINEILAEEWLTEVEITEDKLIFKANSAYDNSSDQIHYRVKEQFDITGKYAYLNSVVRVVAKEGKTEMKLPEGITLGGKNSISVAAMNGERIVEQMQAFFADAMFTPNAKLRHTVDGTVMYKDYAIDGNSLSFELNKGHQLNATSFPDEDGDRLFIIIPKQKAWIGGLADLIRKENPSAALTDEVIAAIETEFMNTFETFTVVLSLSKTGKYNAAEDVDPYKDYPQLIVGKWFDFTPETSVFANYRADNTFDIVGLDMEYGEWLQNSGTYRLEGNKLYESYTKEDGSHAEVIKVIEIKDDKLVLLSNSGTPGVGEKVNYRVKESFDIKGSYTHLNAVANIEPVEEKTTFQLPEGITFEGENAMPVEKLPLETILMEVLSCFDDITFAADGKLEYQMDDETKHKNYTHEGNSLVFNLYEESDVYKVNATTFPDEDGDRLFIIMPKQGIWMGGFVKLIEKETPGLKMTEAQIKELETEFMATFETFTVILSLKKK